MKMVKSLLLGTAAGLVAVAGAQAADLPVKAKPVQYVKICSLYGAGFYYIPGTDTCIKIGGFVRAESELQCRRFVQPLSAGINALDDRGLNFANTRARGVATFDARTQTEYGTLRVLPASWRAATTACNGSALSAVRRRRMFIQFAGSPRHDGGLVLRLLLAPAYSNQTNVWAPNRRPRQ